MCICSVHGYGGEFTFPATAGRIVGHVAEGVYAHHPFTYIGADSSKARLMYKEAYC